MSPVKEPQPLQTLIELTVPTTYDPERTFKEQLRAIEVLRELSHQAHEQGDLENAFVYLGRAASLVNNYLPNHSQYDVLSAKQQTDLAKVRLPEIFQRNHQSYQLPLLEWSTYDSDIKIMGATTQGALHCVRNWHRERHDSATHQER